MQVVENSIKAVIFDFDGVIANTDLYHFLAWKKAVRKIGINMDPSIQDRLRGLTREDTLKKILKIFNVDISEKQFNEITELKNQLYKEYFDEDVSIQDVLPGILVFLKYLKENNYKVGLASISKNAETIIEKIGIREYFDVIVDPSTVEKVKPQPDIFLMAARLLNVRPWECVGIEDSQVGVEAINSSMMRSICIDFHNSLSMCSLKLNSTQQLTPERFLKFINEYKENT